MRGSKHEHAFGTFEGGSVKVTWQRRNGDLSFGYLTGFVGNATGERL